MADKSIPKLESVTTPTSEDLALIVTDASSAPANKKSTLATFFNKIPTWLGFSTTPIVYTTGEIDVTTPVSFLSVTGSTTFSLPAGTIGQIKMLVCTVAASTPVGVLTPIASSNDGYDTLTFHEKGQSATLIYENSGWIVLSSTASNFSLGYEDFLRLEDGVGTSEGSYSATSTGEVLSQEAEDITGHLESKSFKFVLERSIGTVTTENISTKSISASTDSTDALIKQYDGTEVARIHDGAVVPTATGTSTSLSAGTGLGNRRRILTLGSGNDDNVLTLTVADSGSIIYVTPTNALSITLPLVGTNTGIWFDIIIAANFNKAFTIKTAGQEGVDNITLFCNASDAVAADVGGTDHDVLTFTNALIGSRIELINCVGGDAEEWHAYVRSMNTIDASIA